MPQKKKKKTEGQASDQQVNAYFGLPLALMQHLYHDLVLPTFRPTDWE